MYKWSGLPPKLRAPAASLASDRLLQRRMRCRQSCYRHTVRRARHIVESCTVAERDTARVASMLAADPNLELAAYLSAVADSPLHQLPHTLGVECLEWVIRQKARFEIMRQEAAGIIA